MQMNFDVRRNQGEKNVHRLVVQRVEVDRLFEKAEADGRVLGLGQYRVSHMGNRNTIADGGTAKSLASEKRLEKKIGVHVRGRGEAVDNASQCRCQVISRHVV